MKYRTGWLGSRVYGSYIWTRQRGRMGWGSDFGVDGGGRVWKSKRLFEAHEHWKNRPKPNFFFFTPILAEVNVCVALMAFKQAFVELGGVGEGWGGWREGVYVRGQYSLELKQPPRTQVTSAYCTCIFIDSNSTGERWTEHSLALGKSRRILLHQNLHVNILRH